MGEDKLQKAVNQRQLSDGAFLFILGTLTALFLITAEIALLLKHGAVAVYNRIRSII